MTMPSTMILTICISMVLKRNRGLSLDIFGSRYETAEHKTHISTHKSQKLDTICHQLMLKAESAQVISKL